MDTKSGPQDELALADLDGAVLGKFADDEVVLLTPVMRLLCAALDATVEDGLFPLLRIFYSCCIHTPFLFLSSLGRMARRGGYGKRRIWRLCLHVVSI